MSRKIDEFKGMNTNDTELEAAIARMRDDSRFPSGACAPPGAADESRINATANTRADVDDLQHDFFNAQKQHARIKDELYRLRQRIAKLEEQEREWASDVVECELKVDRAREAREAAHKSNGILLEPPKSTQDAMKSIILYSATTRLSPRHQLLLVLPENVRMFIRAEVVNGDVTSALSAAKPFDGEIVLNSIPMP